MKKYLFTYYYATLETIGSVALAVSAATKKEARAKAKQWAKETRKINVHLRNFYKAKEALFDAKEAQEFKEMFSI